MATHRDRKLVRVGPDFAVRTPICHHTLHRSEPDDPRNSVATKGRSRGNAQFRLTKLFQNATQRASESLPHIIGEQKT